MVPKLDKLISSNLERSLNFQSLVTDQVSICNDFASGNILATTSSGTSQMPRLSLCPLGIRHRPIAPTKTERYDKIGDGPTRESTRLHNALHNSRFRGVQSVSRKSLNQAWAKASQPERVLREVVHPSEIGGKRSKHRWRRRAREADSGTSRCADLAPW